MIIIQKKEILTFNIILPNLHFASIQSTTLSTVFLAQNFQRKRGRFMIFYLFYFILF